MPCQSLRVGDIFPYEYNHFGMYSAKTDADRKTYAAMMKSEEGQAIGVLSEGAEKGFTPHRKSKKNSMEGTRTLLQDWNFGSKTKAPKEYYCDLIEQRLMPNPKYKPINYRP